MIVYWVSFDGQLIHPRTIKPNAMQHLGTRAGVRYEAYIDGKLIATHNVAPNKGGPAYMIWEIKRE